MTNWQRWKGIMKCYPFEEKRLAKWSPPYIVQPKYDGDRCRAVLTQTGHYILLSSEENIIFSVPHINEALNVSDLDIELDGELYSHQLHAEGGQELIHSIISRTVNIHPRHEEMQFHIFDMVNSENQMLRLLSLNRMKDMELDHSLKIAFYYICQSLEDVMRAYDNILNGGYEGMIVRNIHAPYEKKRSIWVMKFKPKQEDIYEITGWEEEHTISGEPKGRLGAIGFKSQDGDFGSVGSGLTNSDRHILWSQRDVLVGKKVKVQYQHLTSGKKVPRFPVFMEVIE